MSSSANKRSLSLSLRHSCGFSFLLVLTPMHLLYVWKETKSLRGCRHKPWVWYPHPLRHHRGVFWIPATLCEEQSVEKQKMRNFSLLWCENSSEVQCEHSLISFRYSVFVWRMNRGQPSSPETERSTAAALNWVVVKGDTLGEMQCNTTRSRRRLRAAKNHWASLDTTGVCSL